MLKRFTFFLCIAASSLVVPAQITAGLIIDPPIESRIVNGEAITITEAPWQVIVRSGGYLCGGSIVAERWVITAAHCVVAGGGSSFDPSQVYVAAGHTYRSDVVISDRIYATAIHLTTGDEAYDDISYVNDIALIELASDVGIGTTSIDAVTLPFQLDGSSWPADATAARVTGWGVYNLDSRTLPDQLQQGEIEVIGDPTASRCGNWSESNYKPAEMLCAGIPSTGETDSCSGDSGGPLVVEQSRVYLAGIVSWGSTECGSAGYPGVYTRVTNYADFIESHLDAPQTTVAIGEIGADSVRVDLTATLTANTPPVTDYLLRYSTNHLSSSPTWTEVTATTSSLVISGLAGTTSFAVQARANNGLTPEDSDWSSIVTLPGLVVTITGPGTVTSDTDDVCATNCVLTNYDGTAITLTATPADGFIFAGWTGGCSGIATCDTTITDGAAVSAVFREIADPVENLRATVGSATASVTPIALGKCAVSSPALPDGLTFDEVGSVAGTATVASGFTEYVVLSWDGDCATQPVDATMRVVNIAVTAAVAPVVTPLETAAIAALDVVESVQNSTELKVGESVQVAYPAGTFDPFEWVVLIAHSEPVTLGSSVSGADGGLSITVEMSEQLDPGEHNLVAMGTESGSSVRTPFTIVEADPTFVALTPKRLLDTRSGEMVGELDGSGSAYELQVTGAGGVPSSDVSAVALNVTAVSTETNDFGGFVTVYPCGTRPDASNLNFTSGQTIPNSVIAPVSDSGKVCFYVYGKAHLLADVSGYLGS